MGVLRLLNILLILSLLEVLLAQQVNYIGVSVPENDIRLEVGSNLSITCILTELDYKSKDIIWKPENLTKGHLIILNSTAVELFIPNVTVQHSGLYQCRTKDGRIVASNDVAIGYNATADIPFNCTINVKDSTMEMVCKWTRPTNKFTPNYTVSFIRNAKRYNCIPNNTDSCTFAKDEIPRNDQIKVELQSSNILNTATKNYTFSRCRHVIFPNNSRPLHAFNYKTSILQLKFPDLQPLVCTDYSILCEITIQNPYDTYQYTIPNITNTEVDYPLKELIANTEHNITVAYQISNTSFPDCWNKGNLTIRTPSAVPAHPPLINPGSYCDLKDGTMFIYWKPVSKKYQNGGHFHYGIRCGSVNLGNTKDCFYHISNFSNICAENNTVTIYSENEVAKSAEHSSININGKAPLPFPENLEIFYNKTSSEYFYELMWNPVQEGKGNYYVFWCEIEHNYDCMTLDWKKTNETSMIISVPILKNSKSYSRISPYVFQVAYEFNQQSSGIRPWERCIRPSMLPPETDLRVNDPKAQEIDFPVHSIEVAWEYPCERKSKAVEGFIVRWFTDSFTNKSEILDVHTKKYIIKDVVQGQEYSIQVETIVKGRSNYFINVSSPIMIPQVQETHTAEGFNIGLIVLIVLVALFVLGGCLTIIVKKVKQKLYIEEIVVPSGLDDIRQPLMEKQKFIISSPSPSPTSSQSSGIGSVSTSELEEQNQQGNEDVDPNISVDSVNADGESECSKEARDSFYLINEKQTNFLENDSQPNYTSLIPSYSAVGIESSRQNNPSSGTDLIPEGKSGYVKLGLTAVEEPGIVTSSSGSNIKMDDDFNIDPKRGSSDFMSPYYCSSSLTNISDAGSVMSIPVFSVVNHQSPYKSVDFVSHPALNNKFEVMCDKKLNNDIKTGSTYSLPNDLTDNYSIVGEGPQEFDISYETLPKCDPYVRMSELMDNSDEDICEETNINSPMTESSEAIPMNSYCKVQYNNCNDGEQAGGTNKGYVMPEKLQLNVNTSSEAKENPFDFQQSSDAKEAIPDYVSVRNNGTVPLEKTASENISCSAGDYVQIPAIEKDIQPGCSQICENNTNFNQNNDYKLLRDLHLSSS